MRVYELATRFGVTNDQMIEILVENDIDVENHMSLIGEIEQEKIFKEAFTEATFSTHKNSSPLEYVEIKGLFNKYDYYLNFEKDINILVAENGFGKTTILNIIVATLEGDKKNYVSCHLNL